MLDIIGNIAILSEKGTIKQAKELLKQHPNITTVMKKSGIIKGKYRTQKLKHLAGIRTKITTHKESNCILKLNVEKCYFSPRSGNERLRIARLVKPREEILCLFNGISPFPLIISKHAKAREIYGIESNPSCHKYALDNLKLNKVENIKLFKGDIKKILPTIKKRFDRIIMPLPKSAINYLSLAKKKIKNKGIIHLYIFLEEKNTNKKYVLELIKKHIKKFKILKITKAGTPKPFTFRICVDIKIK